MQAQRIESDVDANRAEERSGDQRVQMSRAELELYVREGRPTGLLLRSVATLKGLSAAAISKASGIPEALIESIFNDHGVGSIKKGTIKRVATVLGIDLSVMRMAAGQVHVFNLTNAPGRLNAKSARQAVRAVGLLARGAVVAELKVGSGLQSMMWSGRMHVVQSEHFRALFIGARGKKFDIKHFPSAKWVRRERATSLVPIQNLELVKLLVAQDLTEGEFDELFQGMNALTWADIRTASRVNGVSKADLLRFIESRASELDAVEDDAAKKAVLEPRGFLTLVHNEQQRVVNA